MTWLKPSLLFCCSLETPVEIRTEHHRTMWTALNKEDEPVESRDTSGGSRISLRWGHQHMILRNFPKNCVKLKEFGRGWAFLGWPLGSSRDPSLITHWWLCFERNCPRIAVLLETLWVLGWDLMRHSSFFENSNLIRQISHKKKFTKKLETWPGVEPRSLV